MKKLAILPIVLALLFSVTFVWGRMSFPLGGGSVTAISSSTDNAVVRFNGTSGQIQDSGVLIDDSNNFTAGAIISGFGSIDIGSSALTAGIITGVGDLSLDGDLDFVGAQSITTSAGDLTLNPNGSDVIIPDNDSISLGGGADSRLYYDGTDTFWNLRAVGTGDLMVALAGSFPSPDAGTVHIWDGDAGAVTANTASQLVIESSGSSALTILGPNNQSKHILFGEPASALQGRIQYYGSTATPADTFAFWTASTERIRISANAFAFQELTTISTTAGDLTLNPTASLNITLTAGDADAFTANDGTTDYYNIDTRLGTSGIHAHTFDTTNPSFANIPTASFTLANLIGYTSTVTTDADDITGDFATQLHVQRTTLNSDTASTNYTGIVSSMRVRGTSAGTNVILDNMAGIHIEDGGGGGGTETLQHAIFIDTLSAASTNYALTIGNTDADQNLIHVGVAGNPLLSWDETNDIFNFTKGLDLASGEEYLIADASVLTATTLGGAVVNSSLTSLGTIATGTWQGSVIDHERGGIEIDISGIGVGDILGGVSAGTMEIIDGGAASDGDLLTIQSDGTANWEAAAGGATQEFFVPASVGTEVNFGDFSAYLFDNGETAKASFFIPNDFVSIVTAVAVWIPPASRTSNTMTFSSDYGSGGQSFSTHSESTSPSLSFTANQIQQTDISGILTSIVAGDYVGIQLSTASADDRGFIGIRFRY